MSGPDSELAALIGASVVPLAGGDPGRAISLAGALAILAGLLCVAAADVLAEIDRELHEAGADLCFAELKGPPKDRLKRYGLFSTRGSDNFFPTIGQAVDRYLEIHPVNWTDWEDASEANVKIR